jgi:hypothetical protein
VRDETGKALPGVEVRLANVVPASGGRYESALDHGLKTNAEGRFRSEQVPAGKVTIWLTKPGYVRPGLGPTVTTPTDSVALTMMKSASIRVTVDFTGKVRPNGYIVSLEPEGGNKIGTYGGSGNIDPKDQMAFENVPPGRYIVWGQPNPSSGDQRTERVAVELKGGDVAKVTLRAK